VTRDPAEGVDVDGYLATGAALVNVPACVPAGGRRLRRRA